ncbi:MAG: HAD-IA family hydrolase [Planctomycetota bacterium]|nr:HAD-IA family hydrolase [Planctomycetota bacterium]
MGGNKRIRAIFFDIDDTLYSTTEFVRKARENALRAMMTAGLRADMATLAAELDEVVREFSSNDEHHLDRLLLRLPPEARGGANPAVLVAAGMVAYHDTVRQDLRPYEDALEVLRILSARGMRLGIISSGIAVKQAEKLVRLGVLPYLSPEAVFIGEQIGMTKTNPRLYAKAAESLGLKTAECMHVGDRPDTDIDPANEAGMVAVLHARGGPYHSRQGRTAPAYTVHNFWDLLDILRRDFGIGA